MVNFDHIIENAESNDINAAWSNPCFEIWLFAYFGLMPNIGASEKCCKEFATKFKKEAGINYDKANTDIYKKLIEKGDEGKAIKIASLRRSSFKKDNITKPSKMVPCTTVDILVTSIKSGQLK